MSRLRAHRRPAAALAVVLYALVATGVPLPTPTPRVMKASAERFPCESCGCGCSTAAYCWRKCCCHTLGQRLAWARREGVRPPEDVLDTAAAAGYSVATWRPATTTVTRVVTAPKPTCSKCCCVKKPAAKPAPPAPPRRRAKTGHVTAWKALACQGLTMQWLTVGAGLPPVPPEWRALGAPLPATHIVADPSPPGLSWAPTPPPPERRV